MCQKECNRASEKLYIQSIQKYLCLTIMVSKFLVGFASFFKKVQDYKNRHDLIWKFIKYISWVPRFSFFKMLQFPYS